MMVLLEAPAAGGMSAVWGGRSGGAVGPGRSPVHACVRGQLCVARGPRGAGRGLRADAGDGLSLMRTPPESCENFLYAFSLIILGSV